MTRVKARRSSFPGVIVGLLLLPLLFLGPLFTGTAWAHAGLLGTDPADGTVLATAPPAVTLTFSEPVGPIGDATRILDARGEQVPTEVSASGELVTVRPLEELSDGTYVVAWRVLSADSHPIAGGFSFSVGAPSETVVAAPSTDDADPWLAALRIALEGLRYVGLLTALGLVAFRLLVDRKDADGRTAVGPVAGRFRRAETILGITGAVAAVALVPVLRTWQDGGGLGDLGSSLFGADTWASDASSAALLTVVAVFALRQSQVWALGLAAVAAVTSLVLVGHTRAFGPAWLVITADVLHVLTAAAWIGGVLALCLLLIRPPADTCATATAAVVARFSFLAGWLVAGLGAAGLVLFFWIAGEFSALWTTAYGVLVLVKVGLVAIVLAVAAVNKFRLVPAVGADPDAGLPRLRRTVAVEAAILVVVLLVTGALISQSPRPATTEAGTAQGTQTLQLTLGDTSATLMVSPAGRGRNAIQLTIIDAAGRPLSPQEPPTVSVSMPDAQLGPFTAEVFELGAGYWQADVDLLVAGTWTIEVGVRLSQFDLPVASTTLTVD